MIRSGLIAIATCCAILLTGCSSTPKPTTDPLGAAPTDFFIDVTVIDKPTRARQTQPADSPGSEEIRLRPAKFVLFSDGTLRYGPDPNSAQGVNWLPPIARVLTRAQTAQVWSLAQQSGLTDPATADPLTNFNLIDPRPGERWLLVDFRGNDRRWNFIRQGVPGQPQDPALVKLVTTLEELAFADTRDDSNTMIAPQRYEFGPDPYARYRRTEPAK